MSGMRAENVSHLHYCLDGIRGRSCLLNTSFAEPFAVGKNCLTTGTSSMCFVRCLLTCPKAMKRFVFSVCLMSSNRGVCWGWCSISFSKRSCCTKLRQLETLTDQMLQHSRTLQPSLSTLLAPPPQLLEADETATQHPRTHRKMGRLEHSARISEGQFRARDALSMHFSPVRECFFVLHHFSPPSPSHARQEANFLCVHHINDTL